MEKSTLIQNKLGYFEFSPKPTDSELAEYYNKKYFEAHNYKREYTEKEKDHLYLDCLEAEFIINKNGGKFLDMGCGEGFFMDFFHRKGWDVRGLDFTTDGIREQFPELEEKVQKGNLFEQMDKMVQDGLKFDFLSCNNVLEHVTDPNVALDKISALLTEDGIARVKVPNDFSPIQQGIVERGLAEDQFWVHFPDHLSYFQPESLNKLVESKDMKLLKLVSDFPIDFFIFHERTNYYSDSSLGKSAHQARMDVDLTLAKSGISNLVSFREGCASAGTGRNLVAYIKLS